MTQTYKGTVSNLPDYSSKQRTKCCVEYSLFRDLLTDGAWLVGGLVVVGGGGAEAKVILEPL